MFNDFLKNNINLSASFMIHTGNIRQVFCTDSTEADGKDSHLLVNSGIFSQRIVFFFALTITALIVQ